MRKVLAPEETIALNRALAAQALGLGEDHLDGLLHSGQIPYVQVGNRIIIRRQAILEWLEREEHKQQLERGFARPRLPERKAGRG